MSTFEKNLMIDIPLLNNIGLATEMTNAELECYFDILHEYNEHIIDADQSLARIISDLALCMELSIKFRLLQEHWAFIFDDLIKAKEEALETGDFISVSFRHGIIRLRNICGISTSFDKCFELYKLRNKVQHFTLTQEPLTNVLTILSQSINEICDFLSTHVLPYVEDEDVVKDFEKELQRLNSNGVQLEKARKRFS